MNDQTIFMTRAEKVLFEKLNALEKKIDEIHEEKFSESIMEKSLSWTAKHLGLGSETIIKYVNTGKLRARIYRDRDRKKHYRFRIVDIREFQKSNSTLTASQRSQIPSAEEIINEIINGNGKMAKSKKEGVYV